MGKKQTKEYLKEYLRRLDLDEDIRPHDVILYGSFLRDDYDPEKSDIDLLIISDTFEKMDEDDRLRVLYRKTAGLPLDLHLYGFTISELKNISPLNSLSRALTSGVSLYT